MAGMDSAPSPTAQDTREVREAKLRSDLAETLHLLGNCIEAMAKAIDEDDDILGILAGEGIANHLSALPRHVRHVFLEHASDEAAAGLRASERYFAYLDGQGIARVSHKRAR